MAAVPYCLLHLLYLAVSVGEVVEQHLHQERLALRQSPNSLALSSCVGQRSDWMTTAAATHRQRASIFDYYCASWKSCLQCKGSRRFNTCVNAQCLAVWVVLTAVDGATLLLSSLCTAVADVSVRRMPGKSEKTGCRVTAYLPKTKGLYGR